MYLWLVRVILTYTLHNMISDVFRRVLQAARMKQTHLVFGGWRRGNSDVNAAPCGERISHRWRASIHLVASPSLFTHSRCSLPATLGRMCALACAPACALLSQSGGWRRRGRRKKKKRRRERRRRRRAGRICAAYAGG